MYDVAYHDSVLERQHQVRESGGECDVGWVRSVAVWAREMWRRGRPGQG